jgi:IS5 family transposase
VLDRHDKVYGRYPLKVALDGGLAPQDKVKLAKERGVKDVCFAKKGRIEVEDMCRSDYAMKYWGPEVLNQAAKPLIYL